jgi:hypothetical protein
VTRVWGAPISTCAKVPNRVTHDVRGVELANEIFVCYRHQDAAHFAGGEFGQDLMFVDVDAMPLGRADPRVQRQ